MCITYCWIHNYIMMVLHDDEVRVAWMFVAHNNACGGGGFGVVWRHWMWQWWCLGGGGVHWSWKFGREAIRVLFELGNFGGAPNKKCSALSKLGWYKTFGLGDHLYKTIVFCISFFTFYTPQESLKKWKWRNMSFIIYYSPIDTSCVFV